MRWLLLVPLLLAACASTPKRAGAVPRCPEAGALKCLAREVCSYDASRGCEACQCDVGFTPYPQAVNPPPPGPPGPR